MHKGVIILTKAEDKKKALSKVNEFVEGYQDNVWDWWAIGGRWNNTLAPKDKTDKWYAFTKELLEHNKFGIPQSEIDKHQNELQKEWERLGLKGKNPYCNHYNLGEEGNAYDVVPLSECIETVKEWYKDPDERGKEREEEAKKWKLRKKDGGFLNDDITDKQIKSNSMYEYVLQQAGSIYSQDFSFEANTYNIEEFDFSIPEKLDGWYAVMIDMHN